MTRLMAQPHLFTVRVWHEELDDGQLDCRGRVQHGLHGAPRHFQGWSALIDLMMDALQDADPVEIAVNSDTAPQEIETDLPEADTD